MVVVVVPVVVVVVIVVAMMFLFLIARFGQYMLGTEPSVILDFPNIIFQRNCPHT